jgi:thiol-disulfide isomerase/thioredoxin
MKSLRFLLFLLLAYSATAQTKSVGLVGKEELLAICSTENDTTYVINFWATWCKPCVQELPFFEELQQSHPSTEPLKVVLVSLDFEENLHKRVLPFLEKNNIRSKVYLMTDTRYHGWIDDVNNLWSGAIPATLVVRKNKKYFAERSFDSFQDLYDFVHP